MFSKVRSIALPGLLGIALLACITSAHADELTPAKKADILKLLNLNGTERVVEPFSMIVTQSYMQQVVANCPTCSPKIPDVVRTETANVFRAHLSGDDGLLERQVPVYHQRFSHAEIKQLLAFYTSPIGRKFVTESNELTRDSIGVSQQWARELSPEIRKQIDLGLTKAGIKPTPPSSPPPSVLQPQSPTK